MNKQALEQEKTELENRLSEVNKQLSEIKEPKEGEWWCWDGLAGTGKAVSKIKKVDGERIYFTELYGEKKSDKNDWYHTKYLTNPATKEEIEYFMGLHAERLGIKEGVKVDRSGLRKDDCAYDRNVVKLGLFKGKPTFMNNVFYFSKMAVRDAKGNWAKVVEPAKKMVKKSVNLQRKVDKLTTKNKELQEKYDILKAKHDVLQERNFQLETFLKTVNSEATKYL